MEADGDNRESLVVMTTTTTRSRRRRMMVVTTTIVLVTTVAKQRVLRTMPTMMKHMGVYILSIGR